MLVLYLDQFLCQNLKVIFPVPILKGRLPVISDGFSTPRTAADGSPIIHGGLDIDYRAVDSDPPFGTPHVRTKAFFMPDGVPFLAVDDGIVRSAGIFSFGGGVQVQHTAGPLKGQTTFYAHGASINVVKGQLVKAGQKLGIIGHDPRPGGQGFNHLHLELWPDGSVAGRVDPAPHIAGAVKIAPPSSGDALLVGAAVVGSLVVGRWLATRR